MNRSLPLRAALFAALTLTAPFSHGSELVPGPTQASTPLSTPFHLLINPPPGQRKSTPAINPASDEGLNAVQRIKPTGGLEVKLWAAEPMLANPVAFNIDERGRVFVTETYRYRSSTLDIRNYLWMDEEDLASRTIEDRQAMLLRNFGPEGIKELSVESEIVRLIEDTDGDGVADRSSVYADGFNSPLDGISSGVMARRGEVWVTDIPSVWKLTGERRAETRTEVSRGYGIHFSLTGHDLHGLTWGPDGKIYFSFGDRGASVKTKEGTTLNTVDCGGVYRMNPDGTQLEVFADGLRNPQSLLFTENGDIVVGDNDSDGPDEERLVHIVEGGDAGWRIGYQRSPLAPTEQKGPWSAERMWVPRWDGQAAFLLPPICNIEDGNSGVAYYPGTGLNSSYFGQIFICHFKGGMTRSGVNTYLVKPDGASYAIADSKVFVSSVLPTDVRFGPDGKVYISDWTDGYDQPKKGRIYTISDPQHLNDPLVKETQQLIGGDWTKRSSDELAKLLGHADWRVRLEAQYTLAERGADSIRVFARIATTPAPAAVELGNPANLPAFARRHAIWGLGQIAQKTGNALVLSTIMARTASQLGVKDSPALAPLRTLLHDADPEVRAQAIKVLGDHGSTDQADNFIAALKDENGRVKFFAAQSLSKVSAVQPALAARAAPALLDALRANNDTDLYLRHSYVMGLVGGKNLAAITGAITDRSRAVRTGSLLALRRLERPEVARFLSDPDPYLIREAALAINDRPINEAMPALAALIADGVADPRFVSRNAAGEMLADEPVLYRAINANFRVGGAANAAALAKFAANTNAPQKFRLEALTQLALWPNPPQRDRILGIYRPLVAQARNATATTSRDGKAAAEAFAPTVAALLDPASPAPIQTAAIVAIEKLHVPAAADALFAVVRDEKQSEANRATALTALGNNNDRDPRLPEVVKMASASASSALRLAALPIAAKLSPNDAAPVLANFVAKGDTQELKAAFETLGTLKHPTADLIFVEQLKLLAADKIAPAVQLELLEGAAKSASPEVKKLLAERDATLATNPDPVAAFRFALQGGDREKGQRIFENQPTLACVRCHRIGTAPGGDGAPNLADFANKNQNAREHALESIVKPNAKIATGFDTIVLTRKSGGVAVGIVASEAPDAISLRDVEGKITEVKKSDIAKRDAAPSAMPEIYGAILTKTELRDLVEYVATIGTPLPGGRGGRGGRGGGGNRGGAAAGGGGNINIATLAATGAAPAPAAAGGPRGGGAFGRGGADAPLRALRGLTPAPATLPVNIPPPATVPPKPE